MQRLTIHAGSHRKQRGFSIVEIMIALALGIVIMLGVTEVATNNSKLRIELDRTGRQIESAAYALRLIESDLMSAGFFGEMGEQAAGATPPMCPDDATELEDALAFPVHGGDATFACVTADATDADQIDPKAGSDFIVARRANSCALGTAGCDAAASNFHIQVNSCFDPSDSAAPLPGIDFVISTDTDTATTMVFRERDDNCATAGFAPIYRLLNRIYYVNDDDQLVRAELVGSEYTQTPLVDGVETMRVEYGLDEVGADGLIDTYTDSPTNAQWPNVVMVRLSLVVRNLEPSGGFTDERTYTVGGAAYTVPVGFENHRRQVYVRTISMRNIAGRRQS